MAQPPEDEEQFHSYFPNPPPFYKHFTSKNLDALAQLKEEDNITDDPDAPLTAAQILALPAELRYLVPPEPPTPDTPYSVFGKKTKINEVDDYPEVMSYIRARLWDEETNTGFLDWKYEQLYPSSDPDWSSLDRQTYLFRFLRSIILSYIELLGIIAQNPTTEARDKKLKDIMTLVLNMHALINEYRPHQARETLIRIMEEQVERKRAEVEGVRKMATKVKEVLDGFERGVVEAQERDKETVVEIGEEERRKERQREMWGLMDEVLGH
ncbi:Mediator of RNA polymerase II transcription subunit 7 [Kalmusia sp. IMI 367209]|nr:Mediator of RNA polymerase II transcription subunit 7 [Kalmusia sp. IMI 367209]